MTQIFDANATYCVNADEQIDVLFYYIFELFLKSKTSLVFILVAKL